MTIYSSVHSIQPGFFHKTYRVQQYLIMAKILFRDIQLSVPNGSEWHRPQKYCISFQQKTRMLTKQNVHQGPHHLWQTWRRTNLIRRNPPKNNVKKFVISLFKSTFPGWLTINIDAKCTNDVPPKSYKKCIYLMNPPLFCWGCAWLGWWGCTWLWGSVEEGRKSSSMSRTLASKDLEDFSFRSSSFILFCIIIVFLVIFSPGLDIRRNQGIHWRNNTRTWLKNKCY